MGSKELKKSDALRFCRVLLGLAGIQLLSEFALHGFLGVTFSFLVRSAETEKTCLFFFSFLFFLPIEFPCEKRPHSLATVS
jgi:hypothetical protein